MNIPAIAPIAPAQATEITSTLGANPLQDASGVHPTNFGNIVSQGLEEVNKTLIGTQTDLQQLATGDAQNLHQIMIRLEESRISFQLFMQVRNRLLEAYQDIMKMQV